jgi:hypothetical protein
VHKANAKAKGKDFKTKAGTGKDSFAIIRRKKQKI